MQNLSMTINDLKETAALAYISQDEDELAGIFPAFSDMLKFLEFMENADNDKTAFPQGSSPAASVADFEINDPALLRADTPVLKTNGDKTAIIVEKMLNNSGDRDGAFIAVPNVL